MLHTFSIGSKQYFQMGNLPLATVNFEPCDGMFWSVNSIILTSNLEIPFYTAFVKCNDLYVCHILNLFIRNSASLALLVTIVRNYLTCISFIRGK